ncbi:hypothetical protein EVAR_41543_1 [Eumeta japonica]|uniref:Uncharacterized protein n=1 Tax=Eumeta variegata TaxID=151549 RepID=A0A4C1X409_EUMVA|nr:hypothetical protein EVAR_41543_1 [Eumeta japonica]
MNVRRCVPEESTTSCLVIPADPDDGCPAICRDRLRNPPVPPLQKHSCNPKCEDENPPEACDTKPERDPDVPDPSSRAPCPSPERKHYDP